MVSVDAPPVVDAHRHHRHGWWWKTLLVGLALWALTVVVTGITLNANLIPTLILLGSFLVPFCVVLFVVERVTGTVSTLQVVLLFVVGGVCGVLGASLLEANLHASLWIYVGVGLIEELVKGVILIVAGARVRPKTRLQGALLGATVGAGFSAFESAGYAFNAAISSQGINLVSLLQTEMIRAILAPVGHVLWTAIFGAVLFGFFSADRGRSRLRWGLGLIVAYLGVSLLHSLWDSMSGISSFLALLVTGNTVQVIEYGFLPASAAQEVSSLATVLYIIGLAVVSAVGAFTLWRVARTRGARTPELSGAIR
ncbi:MAG: protease PrsW [Glaciihabitans sp.]|nr:protease PrsW [Glaciihabitans sp.]